MQDSGSKSKYIVMSNDNNSGHRWPWQANSSMNVDLHQISQMEVNCHELHKHLVIWVLVGGASFGENSLLFPMNTESSQQTTQL